jgi:hypothetical protein
VTRRFITSVICPECGRTGTTTWEETENPADEKMTPKSVSAGFKVSGGDVLCIDCGVAAVAVTEAT